MLGIQLYKSSLPYLLAALIFCTLFAAMESLEPKANDSWVYVVAGLVGLIVCGVVLLASELVLRAQDRVLIAPGPLRRVIWVCAMAFWSFLSVAAVTEAFDGELQFGITVLILFLITVVVLLLQLKKES